MHEITNPFYIAPRPVSSWSGRRQVQISESHFIRFGWIKTRKTERKAPCRKHSLKNGGWVLVAMADENPMFMTVAVENAVQQTEVKAVNFA